MQGREAMFRGRLLRCWQEEQQRSVLSFSMMVEQPNLYPLQCFGLILTLDTASGYNVIYQQDPGSLILGLRIFLS